MFRNIFWAQLALVFVILSNFQSGKAAPRPNLDTALAEIKVLESDHHLSGNGVNSFDKNNDISLLDLAILANEEKNFKAQAFNDRFNDNSLLDLAILAEEEGQNSNIEAFNGQFNRDSLLDLALLAQKAQHSNTNSHSFEGINADNTLLELDLLRADHGQSHSFTQNEHGQPGLVNILVGDL